MLRRIVESSLRFRFLAITIAAVMMFFGVLLLPTMPVDVFPEFASPYVEIQTEAIGLSAEEVEALITVPLEADLLNGVAWLDLIHSESITGLSSIVLYFEPGTDPIRARQMVQERLTQAHALPNVSKPPTMLQPLSATSRVMMIGLSSEELSLIDMSILARWNIRPRLMGVRGVANVAIWGQRQRQLQVQVDPEVLRAEGVTLQQVIATTGEALWVSPLSFLNASTPGTGGFIDTPNQRLAVRHLLPITTAEDLAQVPVVESAGRLRLGDVAEVVEDHQLLIGDAILNDGEGLLLVIEKFPGENTLEVTRGVEEALRALQPGLPGMQIDPTVFRPAAFIELAIENLTRTLVISAICVIVVLLVLHWNWRAALISIVAIPLPLVAAVLVLYFRGDTMNTMVLAGLVMALGVVVDDAIVDVENIMRRLRQRRTEGSTRTTLSIILDASGEVRSVVVYAMFITILPVLPVLFLQGEIGAFLQPLIVSYVLALLVSMVVALTVTPAMSLMLLHNAPLQQRESPIIRLVQGVYDRILAPIIHAPVLSYATVVIALVGGIGVWASLRQELLPEFRETDLLIQWEGMPGTSRLEMTRITSQASTELQSILGVRNVSAHVGRAVLSDKVVGINSGELWVSLDSSVNYDATVAAVEEVVEGYPGVFRDVRTYLEETSSEALTETEDIIVRIYGYEIDVLRDRAEQVRQMLAGIDGLLDVQTNVRADEPQVEIEVSLDAAERYGLSPGDVRRAAATLLSGIEVGSLFEQQKVFDVIVWSTPETRHSLTSIRELLIDTPAGGHVRLGDVADVRIVAVPTVINREAVSRYVDVSADINRRDVGSIVNDIENALQGVEFPSEYHAELRGAYAETQAIELQELTIGVAVSIAIFLVLQASYESWRLAILTFVTLPTALVGGVLAVLLAGGILSLGSVLGFATVFAIAARHCVLLINHYRRLETREGETFGLALVLRGSRERMVPSVMTALTVAAAIAPLAIAGNIPGHEIGHPMAIVILGGLTTSTLFNLFVVPTLYLRFGSISKRDTADLQPVQS